VERRGARAVLASLRGHEIIEIGAPEWERLRTYIQLDLAGVVVAVAWLIALRVAGVEGVDGAWLVAIVSLLVVMAAFLLRAIQMIHRFRRFAAVVIFAVSNWLVAVIVTSIVPFALAILTLAVLLPVLVAVQHMNHARLSAMLGATMLAGTILVAASTQQGIVAETEALKVVAHALALAFIPFITVLVSLAAWQNHVMLVARAEALQESRARLVAAADRERCQIERNLHDGAQRRLVAAAAQTRAAQRLLGTEPEEVGPLLARLVDDLQVASAELRNLAHGIYPPQLAQYGLETALRAVAQHAPLPTTVRASGMGRYPPEIEINLYFCVLEALQNAIKHAGDQATVAIALQDRNGLSFDFQDTGNGTRPDQIHTGSGMTNMNDRIGAIGGTLTIDTRPGGGLHLHGHLPRSVLESAGVRRSVQQRGGAVRTALQGIWLLIAWLYTAIQRDEQPHPHPFLVSGLRTIQTVALVAGVAALAAFAGTRTGPLLALAGGCAVAALLVVVAVRFVRRDRVEHAIAVSAAITWCYAITLTALVPAALPYATLVTVSPVLLSVAFLPRRRFKLIMACTVATAVAVTAAGRFSPGLPFAGVRAHPWIVPIVIALVLLGLTRASFLAWQNHVMLVARAEALQESRARLVAAADRERRQIERDLHDGAQQRLVAAAVQSRGAPRQLATQPGKVGPLLAQLTEDLQEAGTELRDLAHGIYPPQLAEYGLETALLTAARHSPLPTAIHAEGVGRYPPEIEINLYFCLLEALQNAIKHAGEKATVAIELRGGDGLTFDFTDSGEGARPERLRSGHGITNMYDRLGAIGGTLTIETRPGAGLRLHGDLPGVTCLGRPGS
jgi:signal transduction histidine kinase